MTKHFTNLVLIVLLFATGSCKKTFEYSPYSGETLDGYTDLNTITNIQKIKATAGESGSFKVAFLSDTHYYHDELEAAIKRINSDDEISFVVVCGDLSDQGLTKEYIYFYEQVTKVDKPVLTVIGNHDYLANAEDIYATMFGANNYILDHQGYRFIFFDNVFWEKNATPDFDWLSQQASAAMNAGAKPILISHIPFFGDQYDSVSAKKQVQIVEDNNISLSVHGHQHTYSYTSVSQDKYKCLVVPAIGKRSYCVVTFDANADAPVVNSVNF